MKTLHLAIIIMSILLVILLQPVHAQNPPEINPRNVTLLIGFDSPSLQRCCESIALSHDGSMLAYSIDSFDVKSANWKSFLSLYFFKNQTRRSLDLNNNLERIYDLNFSPDDKKLLFVGSSCDKKQSTRTYYVFSPSDIQLHCNTLSNITSVDWMPDGSIVILRNNEKNDTISIYHNGTEKLLYEKQIEPPYVSLNSSNIWSISASPDGKKIALWYLVMFDHKTQILDVNTGKIITTVDGGHPEWSADSHTLSYTLPTSTGFLSNGARGVDTSINLLDIASNKTTALYHIPTGVDFTSITPNGTKVLYATNPTEPYKFFGIKAGIYAINLVNGNNMTPSSIRQPMLTIDSPLKQFKSGVAANHIICKKDLYVILKAANNLPACVDMETGKKLVQRGWATTFGINMNDYWSTCNKSFPQSDYGTQVLYMPVNSIGKICLRYANYNNEPETVTSPGISDPNNSYQKVKDITIWTYTPISTISKDNGTTVAYFIKTGNQTGFYGLSIPSCGEIPFAVGYNNDSNITSRDFPFLGVTVSCPPGMLYPQFDGIEGIGIKYIP